MSIVIPPPEGTPISDAETERISVSVPLADVVAAPSVITTPKIINKKSDPPLLSIQVSNPITYIKKWWKKVIADEGIDLKLKIHPLTALMLILAISAASFGVGRFTVPAQIVKYLPAALLPSPSPLPEVGFMGLLQKSSGGRFYLVPTTSAQAVNLDVPTKMNLASSVGKRVFVSGKYDSQSNTLTIANEGDVQLLLQVQQLPKPTPTQ